MKYVLANWKMYLAGDQAAELLRNVQVGLAERFPVGRQPPGSILFVGEDEPTSSATDQAERRLGAGWPKWTSNGATC